MNVLCRFLCESVFPFLLDKSAGSGPAGSCGRGAPGSFPESPWPLEPASPLPSTFGQPCIDDFAFAGVSHLGPLHSLLGLAPFTQQHAWSVVHGVCVPWWLMPFLRTSGPLCRETPFCLSIHLAMDIWVVSRCWLLWVKPLWTWVCACLCRHVFPAHAGKHCTSQRSCWVVWWVYVF